MRGEAMKRLRAPALAGLIAAGLSGCAAPRDPWGLEVSRGREPAPLSAPDSLQAELTVSPAEPGSLPFTARLYARPPKNGAPASPARPAYRLDAFGFSAAALASYRWSDGAWLLVRHDEKRFWEGRGNGLEVEGASLSLPDVHAVLGFLWGELLPGFPGEAFAADTLVRWTHQGESWQAVFDPVTGACREARSPSLKIRYALYKSRDGRALPEQAEIFVDGRPAAVLRLRGLVRNPAWRKNPFLLPVPAAYSRGNALEGGSGAP
jgi:hypothetical protein